MTNDKSNILLRIQKIIVEYFKISLERILLTSTLKELKIDFFDLLKLVNLIEKKFSIEFEVLNDDSDDPLDTIYDKIHTIQDLVNLTKDQICKPKLKIYKLNHTIIYKYGEIEISERYIALFTSFTLFCDYHTNNKTINLLDSRLDPLYQLSLSANLDDYSTQLRYLRYEIPMSKFVPDSQIIEFLILLKETRESYQ